jgi:hypothetical protein
MKGFFKLLSLGYQRKQARNLIRSNLLVSSYAFFALSLPASEANSVESLRFASEKVEQKSIE